MNLLVDYVQPLTNWLQENPHWSLFITFLISLAESLAIIGSLVPGSVTMTAIGILAGSGIMRIDLTLLAAILGAVAGDSLSYTLGYVYSERLADLWPFRNYPQWLTYGKEFFAIHGGKSVLLGRFIGPLRSIIPVIAGIMHMKHWQFLFANVLSAIGWALLYVMPGVIIGAASHELSTESATRLFMLILILLASLWLVSLMIKWLLVKLRYFFKENLHSFWLKYRQTNFFLNKIFLLITPEHEKNHYTTASLALLAFISFTGLLGLIALTIQGSWLNLINTPTYMFIQSIHTFALEAFFIFCSQLIAPITLLSLFIISCCWFIYNKHFKAIYYLSSLIVVTCLIAYLLGITITTPRPQGVLVQMAGSSFPAINLMVATAVYGFILFYFNRIYLPLTTTLRSFVFGILGLSGLGTLYLGDYWLSDVLTAYFGGITFNLVWCLIYRKNNLFISQAKNEIPMIFSLFVILFLTASLSTYYNFQTISYNHTFYSKEFVLSEAAWWSQQQPQLPIYRLSRIGKRISLLNIEYSGDLKTLEKNLVLRGWETHNDSFFNNLTTWLTKQTNHVKLPLLTQLYENKPPSLIMIYRDQKTKLYLELRIWESNYNLLEFNKPLWIGSMHSSAAAKTKSQTTNTNPIDPADYLFTTHNPFKIKKIMLPSSMIKTTGYPTQPLIILIKETN